VEQKPTSFFIMRARRESRGGAGVKENAIFCPNNHYQLVKIMVYFMFDSGNCNVRDSGESGKSFGLEIEERKTG
jgi:hypothetical protein